MEKIIINGGRRLTGEVTITGAKNAALGILPATVLASDKFLIENLPDIQDIRNYISIMKKLGAKIRKTSKGLSIDTTAIADCTSEEIADESTKMRASYYLLGALLGRNGFVELPPPGGCDIGARPIDLHIKGFEALGAKVDVKGSIKIEAPYGLKGTNIYMDVASVGATINIMLAAVKAEGLTIIENAAKEPHVVDIANFLNLMGAKIKGAGTDVIRIMGVEELHGCEYSVVPDQITAGTYMIAAAATKGDVLIKNVIPPHLDSITAKLIEMGADVSVDEDDNIRVVGREYIKPCNVKTLPYPGFPTDLQQPMGLIMCLANGVSSITESIFENRFRYVTELQKMGANVRVNGNTAVFTGPSELYGTKIQATDLRAGAAMILAGLVAKGTTEITNLKYIDRGYENIEENFRNLGADIKRVDS
ncbi:UDP-N-acetylglucosamine 1-carboxyvinyltransferase [Anaerofustis stercorihominis]|uniref:UDP-N-acetylglucosamine 1-carboxyvinyltransferase n=1 Tax=Anaerofustis stercorihominis TaxID=214853 RepID=UPI00214C0946|nr:UDP-N-acetylglucosamine 1-carboxyvinyltransferase [Anaerofustis stercorihominis]MCR2032517.1 UDP-N-acetylglucosamine 1-carboxyvinyltransferase [Anaerofustis stercorihominis]